LATSDSWIRQNPKHKIGNTKAAQTGNRAQKLDHMPVLTAYVPRLLNTSPPAAKAEIDTQTINPTVSAFESDSRTVASRHLATSSGVRGTHMMLKMPNDQAQGPPLTQTGDHGGNAANRPATPIEAAGGGSLGRPVRG
jgi:hypothetical protein